MKYTLLGFLLTAIVCGSGTGASYVCLQASSDLPPCNFDRMEEEPSVESDLDKTEKIEKGAVMESLYEAADGTVVIYKLEGCIPERLPFTLPKCKTEETSGRSVEIHRLFPFAITGDPPTAPLIFPEVEIARLFKSTGDFNEKKYNPIISRQDLNKESSASSSKKRKKLVMENLLKKNGKNKKLLDSEAMDPSVISRMILPVFQDSAERKESYKSKHYRRRNDIDDSKEFDKLSRNSQEFFKASTNPEYEFPYARMIPYDPEETQMLLYMPKEPLNIEDFTKDGSEFPYSRAIPFDPKKHKNLLHEANDRITHHHHAYQVPKYFPHEEASPYVPMGLKQLLMWVQNQDDLSNLKLRKRDMKRMDNELLDNNDWKVAEFRKRSASKPQLVIRKRSTDHARE